MDDIKKYLEETLHRYFSALQSTGYLEEDNMYYLLILTHIQELTEPVFYEYMTVEYFEILKKAINTLACKSCLFDPLYNPTMDDIFRDPLSDGLLRGTLQLILRGTQNSNFRREA